MEVHGEDSGWLVRDMLSPAHMDRGQGRGGASCEAVAAPHFLLTGDGKWHTVRLEGRG